MDITREALEARKQDLLNGGQMIAQRIEQLKADLQATTGAIQDCDYWLEQLDAPAPPAAGEPETD